METYLYAWYVSSSKCSLAVMVDIHCHPDHVKQDRRNTSRSTDWLFFSLFPFSHPLHSIFCWLFYVVLSSNRLILTTCFPFFVVYVPFKVSWFLLLFVMSWTLYPRISSKYMFLFTMAAIGERIVGFGHVVCWLYASLRCTNICVGLDRLSFSNLTAKVIVFPVKWTHMDCYWV